MQIFTLCEGSVVLSPMIFDVVHGAIKFLDLFSPPISSLYLIIGKKIERADTKWLSFAWLLEQRLFNNYVFCFLMLIGLNKSQTLDTLLTAEIRLPWKLVGIYLPRIPKQRNKVCVYET